MKPIKPINNDVIFLKNYISHIEIVGMPIFAIFFKFSGYYIKLRECVEILNFLFFLTLFF